jgi:hypothetical protein
MRFYSPSCFGCVRGREREVGDYRAQHTHAYYISETAMPNAGASRNGEHYFV